MSSEGDTVGVMLLFEMDTDLYQYDQVVRK
jgi:hypothetical protein